MKNVENNHPTTFMGTNWMPNSAQTAGAHQAGRGHELGLAASTGEPLGFPPAPSPPAEVSPAEVTTSVLHSVLSKVCVMFKAATEICL